MNCSNEGCENVAHFNPYLKVWAKEDEKRTGKMVQVILEHPVCTTHASIDPSLYKCEGEALKQLVDQLEGEPDLENMVVQFFGNSMIPWEITSEHLKTGKPVASIYRGLRKAKGTGTIRDAQKVAAEDVGELSTE